ncbi:MAG TPA: hypothetical protein VJP04_10020 [Terriglobales bacterium]|nr:hypothetical protein [Terriglobales bacterium]
MVTQVAVQSATQWENLFALEERGFSRAVTALKQLLVILRKREPRLRGQRDEGPDAFQPLTTKAMRQLKVRRYS